MFSQKEITEAKEKTEQLQRFRTAYIKYGSVPFLMALHRLENEEQYELCQIAKETIQRHNLSLNDNIPNRISKQHIKGVKKEFQKLLGETFEGDFTTYAELCYNYMLNIKENKCLLDFNPNSDNWICKFK